MTDTSDCRVVQSLDGGATEIQLQRWRGGDSVAFRQLYGRFAPLVRARVRRHRAWPAVAAQMQVEDVEQEVWARAVPAATRAFTPSGPGSFAAFLGREFILSHSVRDPTLLASPVR